MRIVAITRALNEADIIEAFVRHTGALVVHHIIMDNGSTDGTVEILRALKEEGFPLTVFQSKAITFNESDALTQLYQVAVREFQPDWVLCVDADEFLDDRRIAGGFHVRLERLKAQSPDLDYIQIPMVNYISTSKDNPEEPVTPLRMVRRRAPSEAYKIILRGDLPAEDVSIAHGSHFASIKGRKASSLKENDLWLAHYSERSPYQYIAKFIRGWSKVLATGPEEIERKTAYHYQRPYQYMLENPAALLRNGHFMGFKDESPDLVLDPIYYRGEKLRHTPKQDEAVRAARCLMGFLNEVTTRHGVILDMFPEVREQVRQIEMKVERII